METKKNSKGLVVVLSVLVVVLLVICLLLGYIAFAKDDNNSNGKENESVEKLEEDNDKSEDLDVSSELVNNLYKMTSCSKHAESLRKEIYGGQKLTVDQMSDSYKQLITTKYYENNVSGAIVLLQTMKKYGVNYYHNYAENQYAEKSVHVACSISGKITTYLFDIDAKCPTFAQIIDF